MHISFLGDCATKVRAIGAQASGSHFAGERSSRQTFESPKTAPLFSRTSVWLAETGRSYGDRSSFPPVKNQGVLPSGDDRRLRGRNPENNGWGAKGACWNCGGWKTGRPTKLGCSGGARIFISTRSKSC